MFDIAPPPFQEILTRAAGQFEGEVNTSSRTELQRALGEVTGICTPIVSNRYPFFRGTDREVPFSYAERPTGRSTQGFPGQRPKYKGRKGRG